ncbi:MAG: hypothetical protein ACI8XC_003278, partial [Gammaproteobacteria bacterium]
RKHQRLEDSFLNKKPYIRKQFTFSCGINVVK